MARHTDAASGTGIENGTGDDGGTAIETAPINGQSATPIDGPQSTDDGPETAGSDDGTGTAIEPEQPRKRRGRRPKSDTGETSPRVGVKISRADLASKLSGAHQLAALATGLPILQLDKAEADEYAGAILEVAKYHSITLDGKLFAWIQLLATVGTIYGTRILMLRRMRAEAIAEYMRAQSEGVDLYTGEPMQPS